MAFCLLFVGLCTVTPKIQSILVISMLFVVFGGMLVFLLLRDSALWWRLVCALLLPLAAWVVLFIGREKLLGLSIYQVPTGSMIPAIPVQSLILVDVTQRSPKLCDIVSFKHQGIVQVKRLVAMPNVTIGIAGDALIKDGQQWECEGVKNWLADIAKPPQRFDLGNQQWFFVGDNRPYSTDSRSFGAIKSEQIIGVVVDIWTPSAD
ncbi:signal peptidase I [Corallincola holothuriorum]|uniref:signal peptidase I n=1 Tax=Corallincola holothuriorum TaxID=2282215 RepID=UPI001314513F|nr:signal peptidase I [Corallincola holothuriorum]